MTPRLPVWWLFILVDDIDNVARVGKSGQGYLAPRLHSEGILSLRMDLEHVLVPFPGPSVLVSIIFPAPSSARTSACAVSFFPNMTEAWHMAGSERTRENPMARPRAGILPRETLTARRSRSERAAGLCYGHQDGAAGRGRLVLGALAQTKTSPVRSVTVLWSPRGHAGRCRTDRPTRVAFRRWQQYVPEGPEPAVGTSSRA